MPMKVNGKTYRSARELCEELALSRQTLWRWRRAELVPRGVYDRRRRILFTAREAAAIRRYAHRLQPVALAPRATKASRTAPDSPGRRGDAGR